MKVKELIAVLDKSQQVRLCRHAAHPRSLFFGFPNNYDHRTCSQYRVESISSGYSPEHGNYTLVTIALPPAEEIKDDEYSENVRGKYGAYELVDTVNGIEIWKTRKETTAPPFTIRDGDKMHKFMTLERAQQWCQYNSLKGE